jgi:hypothetical protein
MPDEPFSAKYKDESSLVNAADHISSEKLVATRE